MDIVKSEHGYYRVLTLSGKITVSEAVRLKEEVDVELNAGQSKLIFDLAKVHFIDSAGLGMLMVIQNRLHDLDNNINIINIPEKILRVFKLSRLNTIFNIYNSIDDVPD